MPSTDISAWPFPVDWTNGYTETLEWKTAVLTSKIGAEQRYSVRIGPRRQLDVPFMVSGQLRAYFDSLMMANAYKPWYVPIPHEQFGYGPVGLGDTVFNFDTSNREFRVGGKLVIRSLDSLDWQVMEIVAVSSSSVTVEAGSNFQYSRGCVIAPALKAQISDIVTASRPTGRVYTGTVRFTSLEATIWPINGQALADVPVFPEDSSVIQAPLLTREPNAVNNLDYKYEYMMETQDNDSSAPLFTAKTNRTWLSQQYTWFLVGSLEKKQFRDLLFRLAGKRGPLWVPTFNDDIPPGWNSINPNKLLSEIKGRERAMYFNSNGTYFVIAAQPEQDATDGIPPDRLTTETVRRVSYLSIMRFDQDAIEIQHESNGVATVSIVLRDAPDLRISANYAQAFYDDNVRHNATFDEFATNPASTFNTEVTVTGP